MSFNLKKALYKKFKRGYISQLMDYKGFTQQETENYIKHNKEKVRDEVLKAAFIKANEFTETVASNPVPSNGVHRGHKRLYFSEHPIFGNSETEFSYLPVNEFLNDERSREEITRYLKGRGLPTKIELRDILHGGFNELVVEFYKDFLRNKELRGRKKDIEIFGSGFSNAYAFPRQCLEIKEVECDKKSILFVSMVTVPAENSLDKQDFEKIVVPLVHIVAGKKMVNGGEEYHVQPLYKDSKNLTKNRIVEPTLSSPPGQNEDEFFRKYLRNIRGFGSFPKIFKSYQSVDKPYLVFNHERIWDTFYTFDFKPSKKESKKHVEEVSYKFPEGSFNL